MPLWERIAREIGALTNATVVVEAVEPVGGGCINQTYRLRSGKRDYFVKLNERDVLGLFQAEAAGLLELGQAGAIRTPAPVCCGLTEEHAYLVLEYLDLRRPREGAVFRALGGQLAALHRLTGPFFGWRRDNTIGATPQPNPPSQHWVSFWRQQRLGFQLDLAARRGYTGVLQQRGDRLRTELGAFFTGHEPAASFLHGDLWSGNVACDAQNNPVLFDPAVYYGDRETDVAMTELFGGFGPDFYAAYQDAFPLQKEYRTRRTLYNLYHVLNHLNLFGGGYLTQAQRMVDQLLAELR
jgi:fructosamine-3-kinase